MTSPELGDFLSQITRAAAGAQDLNSKPRKLQKLSPSPAQEKETPAPGSTDVPAFGFTEINKLEYSARSLQKSIRAIIDHAPTMEKLHELQEDPSVDMFAKQELKTNKLLHMVSKLKTLYEKNQLGLFSEILDTKVSLEFKRQAPDSSLTSLVDSKEKKASTEDEHLSSSYRHSSLPPLPVIHSGMLRARVFQHKSTSANKTYLADKEIVSSHNERIEFLGDSVLNTLMTLILFERFPYANEGQLSQMRSVLVSNKTLAEFSIAYGFDKNLRCTIDESSLRTGKQKIYADIFEAYLGALQTERGLDLLEVKEWLSQLYNSKLTAVDGELKKSKPINKDAKTELYSLVGSASLHPIYKVIADGNGVHQPYKVQCIMEDTVLGEGEAPGLKDAGLRAAMSALKNKPMLEKFGRRRLETDRSVSMAKPEESTDEVVAESQFPLVADKSVLPNKFAKNEAYAFFGKHLGLTPNYEIVFEEENKRYRAELRVKEVAVSVAFDESKKNAMSRAATVILDNKHMLNDIMSWIG